jgi:hypothetical protein
LQSRQAQQMDLASRIIHEQVTIPRLLLCEEGKKVGAIILTHVLFIQR